MADIPYSFGLRIKDKEINISGDRIFVENQMEKWLHLFEGELPTSLAPRQEEVHTPNTVANNRRPPTLADFIKTKEPKHISDLVLVVGLYLERFQQKNLFTRADLMQAIFEPLKKTPEEVQEAITTLVTQQFLSETQTMGRTEPSYSLTFTGEQAVKDGFNHDD